MDNLAGARPQLMADTDNPQQVAVLGYIYGGLPLRDQPMGGLLILHKVDILGGHHPGISE